MAFDLNDDQKQAVSALRGRVLIRAGAGSGKTRTLAERFAASLDEHAGEEWTGADVDEVLTITFTEKAAAELAERIRSTLRAQGRQSQALEVDTAWISTIHGFCSRLLRRYALEAGLDPSFSVADTVESGRMRQAAFESAAQRVVETPDGETLFSAFAFEAVYETTEKLLSALVSRGLEPLALEVQEQPDVVDVYSRALVLFDGATEEIRACEDAPKTVASQLEACAQVVETLSRMDPSALPPEDLGMQLWSALQLWGPKGRCGATAEIIARIQDARPALMESAAASAAAPLARAMRELAIAYSDNYETVKRERGILDFDDLQLAARKLLRDRQDIRARSAGGFRLVMVDEFQDTDRLQLEIVESIAGDNLCTVGDQRQSIYRFRGADLAIYERHVAGMVDAGARDVKLVDNYRSHGDLLDFVNAVFGSEALFGDELLNLEHGRQEAEPPYVDAATPRVRATLVNCGKGKDDARAIEATSIAEQFAQLRDEFGVRPSDMVVLLKAYRHADAYAKALRRRGFETMIVGGHRFFDVPAVLHLRSLLRAVANPADDRAIAEVLVSPLARLTDDALWRLANPVDEAARSRCLWDALGEGGRVLSADQNARAVAARELIERARERAGRVPLSELLLRAVEESDLDLLLLASGDEGYQGYANVLKLARMADEFESTGGAGVAGFEAYLSAKEAFRDHMSPASLADDDSPAVRLMSIHASKGLEFPVVALPELGAPPPSKGTLARWWVEGDRMLIAATLPAKDGGKAGERRTALFKQMREEETRATNEETKRLFYVACTRAREVLVLTGSGKLDKAVSPDEATSMLERLVLALAELPSEGEGDAFVLAGVPMRMTCVDVTEQSEAATIEGGPADVGGGPSQPRPAPRAVPPSEPTVREPQRLDAPRMLSYSDLGLFERCNKRFWAEKILRLGKVQQHKSGDARTFGSAVHAVLQSVDDAGNLPSTERMAALARYFELSGADATRMRTAAQGFVESRVGRDLVGHEVVRREWPFAIEMGEDDFLLHGSVDAYGRTGADGLIVDYKTGSSGAEADLAQRYELQARCYALVALRDGCQRVRVLFVRPELVDVGGQPQQVIFEFDAADGARIADEIVASHRLMSAEQLEPLPVWDSRVCEECPIAGGVCTVKPPPSWR